MCLDLYLGKNKKLLFSNRGQIALPALLVIPTLLLFVYLLFETAKVSREKIRHQFALDSAVFIELTNHTDYLNRTAFVNGPFPYRIFKELFDCPPEENYIMRSDPGHEGEEECMFDIFYEMGAYPLMVNDTGTPEGNDKTPVWEFEFADRMYESGIEEEDLVNITEVDPDVPENFQFLQLEKLKTLELMISTVQLIADIYYQVYSILGDVQKAQMDIYNRLVSDASFLRKSYFLNAGSCAAGGCAQSTASTILRYKLNTELKLIKWMHIRGKGERVFIESGDIISRIKRKKYTFPGNGLFQLAIIDGNFSALRRGVTVYEPFTTGNNFFNMDLNVLRPQTRSTISIAHPVEGDMKSGVWPNSTPKFRARLYP